MFIKATDPRITWGGIISLEEKNGAVIPWRLPFQDLDLFPNAAFHDTAVRASGVRIRFRTDSTSVKVCGVPIGEGYETGPTDCQVDLCIDNAIIQTVVFDKNNAAVFTNLPIGDKVIELWFSPSYGLTLNGIEVDDNASFEKAEDQRRKWITYGSSITHCVRAASPAMIWPAIVAREKNLNLTSLGYGGQCKLDPMMARLIRDMEADFISLKLGINTYGCDLSPRTFPAAVIGAIAIIREKHKDTPLAVCSPIYSPPRETNAGTTGNTLKGMREQVKTAVESFQKRGDNNIYYVDGLKIFGAEQIDNLPDELHPDAKGMEFMAENFIREIFEKHNIFVSA